MHVEQMTCVSYWHCPVSWPVFFNYGFLLTVMTGAYGGSVNITCTYQGSHKQPLYLCRAKSVGHWEFEDLLVTSLSPYHSRYFLNDDKHDGVFTVTITDLRSEDAGTYWCGEWGAETKTVVRLKVTRGEFQQVHYYYYFYIYNNCIILLLIWCQFKLLLLPYTVSHGHQR